MIATIASSAGVIIALIALAIALWQSTLIRRQVSHNENLNRAQLHQRIAQLFIEVDVFFVNNPQLRPYFYEGRPVPRASRKRAQVTATAEMFADLAEYCTATEVVILELADDWDKYFEHLYERSPALRAYWAEYGDYYPERVWKSFGATKVGRHKDPAPSISLKRLPH